MSKKDLPYVKELVFCDGELPDWFIKRIIDSLDIYNIRKKKSRKKWLDSFNGGGFIMSSIIWWKNNYEEYWLINKDDDKNNYLCAKIIINYKKEKMYFINPKTNKVYYSFSF